MYISVSFWRYRRNKTRVRPTIVTRSPSRKLGRTKIIKRPASIPKQKHQSFSSLDVRLYLKTWGQQSYNREWKSGASSWKPYLTYDYHKTSLDLGVEEGSIRRHLAFVEPCKVALHVSQCHRPGVGLGDLQQQYRNI